MLISKESLAERLGPAESSAVRKERARTEAMRGTLRDGGVNPDLIDAAVAASRFVVEEVAESADGIKRAVASTAEQATISFRQVYKDTFTGLDAKKVAKGTVLVAAVYIAQKVCEQVILTALRRAGLGALAPKMAFVLMAVAVAPVTEEYARRLSRRMGADNGFTASIATVEFVLGTSTMMSRGGVVPSGGHGSDRDHPGTAPRGRDHPAILHKKGRAGRPTRQLKGRPTGCDRVPLRLEHDGNPGGRS